MKAVNVTTQAQAKCVIESIGINWEFHFSDYRELTCINLAKTGYDQKQNYINAGYTILTFNEWLLEHCKEKYKVGTRFIPTNTETEETIISDRFKITNVESVNSVDENGNNIYGMNFHCVFDIKTMQFAEIITEAQPKQREIVGYAAPCDMPYHSVEKGDIFKKSEMGAYYYGGKGGVFCVKLVESLFTPIYKKTEADEQDEMWLEFLGDMGEKQLVNHIKTQTKFKLVRNENN